MEIKENEIMGEGRLPLEGEKAFCCPWVGTPYATTFTQVIVHQTFASTTRW